MTVKYSKHKWEQIRKVKGGKIKYNARICNNSNTYLFWTGVYDD